MPIQVFSDLILDECVVRMGATGRLMRNNRRGQNGGGFATVNRVWDQSLRRFDFSAKPMYVEYWNQVVGLFEATEGGVYGFLALDPTSQVVTPQTGFLQPWLAGEAVGTKGQGYGVPIFRTAVRIFALNSTIRYGDRIVTRPRNQIIYRNGTPATVGSNPGNYSFNAATGTGVWVADATQAISSITTGATTTLTFSNGTGMVAAMSVGQRAYVSGVSGSAAAILNGRSHVVASKGPTTLVLSVSTTGLSGTGGTASKFPQETDALTWEGGYYVPVQFASDELNWDIELGGEFDGRIVSGPEFNLVEIREE